MDVLSFTSGLILGGSLSGLIFFYTRLNRFRDSTQSAVSEIERITGRIAGDFRGVSERIQVASEQTGDLLRAANALSSALSNPTMRGSWGERSVADILALAGMTEGVHYHRQKTLESGRRPDFSFALPNNLSVHLDSKFPWSGYVDAMTAESEAERRGELARVVANLQQHITDLSGRQYHGEANNSVDFVLLFVPSEPIAAALLQARPALFEFAQERAVVICTPWMLLPLLSLIRMATENFCLASNVGRIKSLLAGFEDQWGKYAEISAKLGKSLDTMRRDYDAMVTTRERGVDRAAGLLGKLTGEGNGM